MRCFVTISGIADDILEQVYSALRNAALIDPTEINTLSSTSLNTSHTEDSTSDTSLLTKRENVWSDADEVEAISCVEMLTTGRSLLYEAFRLIKDYRIRKMVSIIIYYKLWNMLNLLVCIHFSISRISFDVRYKSNELLQIMAQSWSTFCEVFSKHLI